MTRGQITGRNLDARAVDFLARLKYQGPIQGNKQYGYAVCSPRDERVSGGFL